MTAALLEVEDLRVRLPTRDGPVTVVDGVDFAVEPGEVFGVAGESGSGKTMTTLALLRLLPAGRAVDGHARFGGPRPAEPAAARAARGRGPRARDGLPGPDDVAASDAHHRAAADRARCAPPRAEPRGGRARAAVELLDDVRIPDPESALRAYPHQFSGGMRQRIAIAIALACQPKLLIADEPTTALDVTVQAGILRLLDRLRRENGLAVILITHDLGVMSSIADRCRSSTRAASSSPADARRARDARGTRTRAACSTRCRIRRRATAARADPGRAARRRAVRRLRVPPALRLAIDELPTAVPPLVAVGRRLACLVDPFAGGA